MIRPPPRSTLFPYTPLSRSIGAVTKEPEPPPRPHAPSASQNPAWAESVEQHHVIPGVTVREIGLSVYGETRSLRDRPGSDRKSTRLNSSHLVISYAVFCLKK